MATRRSKCLAAVLCALVCALAPASVQKALAQKESVLIGPGDELQIQVFDTPDLDEVARVSDSGDFPLKLGGTVHLGSLAPIEAALVIEKRLIDTDVMHAPRVLVTIRSYAASEVTVLGQVVRPGAYSVQTPRSILDVLALAGGLTDLGDRHLTIERHLSGQQIPYFLSNDAGQALHANVTVYPGDRILVPRASIVYVLGDVGRAGGFPMSSSSSSITVLQAIALAGGTSHSAVPSDAKLIRHTADGGYFAIPLPLSAMQKGKKPDVPMQSDDIVYVPFSYLRNAALGLTEIASSATGAVIYR